MTEQMTHPTAEELSAFSLGQLDPDEAAAVESHISGCESCCETLISLSSDDTFVALLQGAKALLTDRTVEHFGDSRGAPTPTCEFPTPLKSHSRYEISGLIGRGGMGDVFKARHRVMDRNVALKIISCGLVRRPEAVARFHREVKTAAQLTHPNIVASHDAEQAGDLHFLVMEYIDGVDLSNLVENEGPLAVEQACKFILQAARGLQHAHGKGMVHRDIKPHNLMVTSEGVVKILDFGLASFIAESVDHQQISSDGGSELTALGAIMGTPDFISPEQACGARQADVRSDIYSLGATLYFLLAGHSPFTGGNLMNKLKSHAEAEPESLQNLRDDVPAELSRVIRRMMHKDIKVRYQTATAVIEALDGFVAHQPAEETAVRRSAIRFSHAPAVASGLIFALIAAIVFYIQLGKTTLKFEILDPTISVKFADDTVEVNRGNGKTFVVTPGAEHKFRLFQDGIEVETDSLALNKGQRVALKIDAVEGQIRISSSDQSVRLSRWPTPPGNDRVVGGESTRPQERDDGQAVPRGSFVVHVDEGGVIHFENTRLSIDALEKRLKQLVPRNSRETSKVELLTYDLETPARIVASLMTRLQSLGFKDITLTANQFHETPGGGEKPAAMASSGRSWFFESISRFDPDRPPLLTIAQSAASSGSDVKNDGTFEFATQKPQPYWETGIRIKVAANRDVISPYLGKLWGGLEAAAGSHNVKLDNAASGEFDGHLCSFSFGYGSGSLTGTVNGYLDPPQQLEDPTTNNWMLVLTVKEWSGEKHPTISHSVNHPVLKQSFDGHTFGSDGKMAISPNGRRLATSGSEVVIWDMANGTRQHVVNISDATVTSAAFVTDDLLAIGTSEVGHSQTSRGKVLLWDLKTDQLERELSDLAGAVYTLDVSPDGNRIAVGAKFNQEGEAFLWDVKMLQKKMLVEDAPVSHVKFTGDGKHIVTAVAHPQGTVQLWELATGKLIVSRDRVMNPRQTIQALAVTPDSRSLFIAGGNWREKQAEVARYELPEMMMASRIGRQTTEFRAIAISPDGGCVVLGGGDGQVTILDGTTTNTITRFTAYAKNPAFYDQMVSDLVFTRDGRFLLTAADGESAKLWKLPAALVSQ